MTGQRNRGQRFVFSNNKLERAEPPPPRMWQFPAPFGTQEVAGIALAETITISRHLRTSEIRADINLAPLRDLHDPNTPEPTAADERGRSSQTFLVDVIARRGSEERRAVVRGQNIYAVTAPIVVEATERVVGGLVAARVVVTTGEAFDVRDFLRSLSPMHLSLDIR